MFNFHGKSDMKKILTVTILLMITLTLVSCGKKKSEENVQNVGGNDVATSPEKDASIQRYNLDVKKEEGGGSNPCDTLSLLEYVLDNYPKGSYIVNFDKTLTFNIPKPAVIYLNQNGTYVLAVVAMSKPGERLIEPKNIVGYDQSFIDLDSTKLGTAFFYLTLFSCDGSGFTKVWETPIPSHGGFNYFHMEKWRYNGTPYVKVDFHYARGIGHIDYNYFLINGLTKRPHLLMTYKGIDFKRTMANVNNDEFPDYYEFLYYDLPNRVYAKDSVAFIWSKKDSLYYNTRNRRQTRPY